MLIDKLREAKAQVLDERVSCAVVLHDGPLDQGGRLTMLTRSITEMPSPANTPAELRAGESRRPLAILPQGAEHMLPGESA